MQDDDALINRINLNACRMSSRAVCRICRVELDRTSREYRAAGVCGYCYDHDLPKLVLTPKPKPSHTKESHAEIHD